MRYKILLTLSLIAIFFNAEARQQNSSSISGSVSDANGNPLQGATVTLKGTTPIHTVTDINGAFRITQIKAGKYVISVSLLAHATQQKELKISNAQSLELKFSLHPAINEMKELNIKGTSIVERTKLQPFSVDVVDMKKIMDRDVDLNRLMNGLPGISVREDGGLGSGFNYSLNGLSGKAVKFFIDGIPMESFGTSFSINNFPANTIDRIEVYKGVIPVYLGGDALGGAINIVSRKDIKNYLDFSQSTGSFNTQRTTLSGSWRHASTGFTVQTNSFYNYSDNDYKVWGPNVEVADGYGNAIEGTPRFKRFNDDYRSYTIKTEAGLTNTSWADQLLFGIAYSDLSKGIQTGRTMAFVFGDVRRQEKFIMPSLKFAKRNLFIKGLNVNIFGSINKLDAITIDTGSKKYNWRGDVLSTKSNGELGGIRNQKSIHTTTDKTTLAVINVSYSLAENHFLNFNYTLNKTSRIGSDEIFLAEWTIPFRQPQGLTKHISGLSYEMLMMDKRLTNIFFVKSLSYTAKASIYDYRGGSEKELFYQNSNDNRIGLGYAAKLTLPNSLQVKFSIENTSRLPEAAELLGDGSLILNAPGLKPEKSFNINASIHKALENETQRLTVSIGTFFRNTRDFLSLGEAGILSTTRYENINKIRTIGIETELDFNHRNWLQISANATYQDTRNRLKYTTSGAYNNVFNDRLRNTPYLMANGEMRLNLSDQLHIKNKLAFHLSTHYVKQYFLGWPSMGERSKKKEIPSQFVQDAGLGYSFSKNRYAIHAGVRNIFNKLVYDNYLLQKPGRFISLKIRCFIQ